MTQTTPKIKVVQCWDDGVTDDIRLTEILRKHGAKASFNLNSSKHRFPSENTWRFNGIKDVHVIPLKDLTAVYDGFTIANHTATHPHLTQIAPAKAAQEIRDGKSELEQIFGYSVTGFAYPFGDYNAMIEEFVRDADHVYARTCVNVADVYPPSDPMAFHSNCHFLDPQFWTKFGHVAASGGVFYFWGHSYEIVTEDDWQRFEGDIARLSADPRVEWTDLPLLFA